MADHFYKIDIRSLSQLGGKLPFAVYGQSGSQEYVLLFKKESEISTSRVQESLVSGIDNFFVHEADHRRYMQQMRKYIQYLKDNGDFASDSYILAVDELCSQSLDEIFNKEMFDKNSYQRTHEVADIYVDLAIQHVAKLPAFLTLAKEKPYQLKHAITTAIFSILLTKAIKGDEPKALLIAGIAGLLHDIGMTQLPYEVDEFGMDLANQDRDVLKLHPAHAVVLTNDVEELMPEIRAAILEHHEAYDGTGYPKGLKGNNISFAARVTTVADTFAALITASDSTLPLPPQTASTILQKNRKLDQEIVASLVSLLRLN